MTPDHYRNCGDNDQKNTKMKEALNNVQDETFVAINKQLQFFVKQIEELVNNSNNISSSTSDVKQNDKIKIKSDLLGTKQYTTRNSLLTDLLEVTHLKTVYHIFIAIAIILLINTAASDYLQKGEVKLGLTLIYQGFQKFHLVIFLWFAMFFCTLVAYEAFCFWSNFRMRLPLKSLRLKIWDYGWILIFLIYIACFLYFPASFIFRNNIPPVSSLIALLEQIRLLMKLYAFIRTNAPNVLNYKLHAEDYIQPYPEFSKFVYFMFAPVMVYRDSYPRNDNIRWHIVAICVLEFCALIFCLSFTIEQFLMIDYETICLRSYTSQEIIVSVLRNSVPGCLIKLFVFYMVLHVWFNLFAELLQFADRLFYKEWWTATSYGIYYRTWNVVVHDWLYTYIYKDMYEIVTPKSKYAARFMVFFISGIAHEYILGFMLQFFLPVLFVEFLGFGFAFSFIGADTKIKKLFANVFLWVTISYGMGIQISFYCMEFYARYNCPIVNSTLADYFIPRLLTCDCV